MSVTDLRKLNGDANRNNINIAVNHMSETAGQVPLSEFS
jgi:hypothetical protein